MAFVDLTGTDSEPEVEGSDNEVVYLGVTGSVAVKSEEGEDLTLPSDSDEERLTSSDHSSLSGDGADLSDVDSRYIWSIFLRPLPLTRTESYLDTAVSKK